MQENILISRLEALRHNLVEVSQKLGKNTWRPEQPGSDTRAELLVESLWTGLETTLLRQIESLQDNLNEVEKGLNQAADDDDAALKAAWVRYAKILRDSQSLLRECLEIIGTLAIRNKDLDQKILYVADDLIRDCLQMSTGDDNYYLLVHGMEDTFSKTRARIIRLRFPEWTLWDLPLAAHELGHVVIADTLDKDSLEPDDDLRVLTRFLGNQRDSLLGQDAELKQKHQSGAEGAAEAERWAECRVRMLVADAFAAYTMGPAYACSAIMLRLSPSIAAQRDRPSDAQRAHIVLSMLRWVNNDAPMGSKPYTEIIQRLEADWKYTLDRGNPGNKLSGNDETYLKQLAEVFARDISRRFLRRTAMYPYRFDQNDGWQRAREWAATWFEQWKETQSLSQPTNPTGKLRDVLNATWLSRLQITGDVMETSRACSRLAEVGQDLCKAIIAARVTNVPPLKGSAATAVGR